MKSDTHTHTIKLIILIIFSDTHIITVVHTSCKALLAHDNNHSRGELNVYSLVMILHPSCRLAKWTHTHTHTHTPLRQNISLSEPQKHSSHNYTHTIISYSLSHALTHTHTRTTSKTKHFNVWSTKTLLTQLYTHTIISYSLSVSRFLSLSHTHTPGSPRRPNTSLSDPQKHSTHNYTDTPLLAILCLSLTFTHTHTHTHH